MSIYMLRNYLTTIPLSLEEAAAVDGYSRLQTIFFAAERLLTEGLTAGADKG